MSVRDGLKQYKLYAFGNAWKVAHLSGTDICLELILPYYLEGEAPGKASQLCKMVFKYDDKLGGYNLIGVMDIDSDISALNKINNGECKTEKLEVNWKWDETGNRIL